MRVTGVVVRQMDVKENSACSCSKTVKNHKYATQRYVGPPCQMIDDPVWLEFDDIIQLQKEQIDLYGGSHGILSEGLLYSSLARPKNLIAYSSPDLFELAAAYAYGFARNHCFLDGNKRISFVSAAVFLADNGFLLLPVGEASAVIFESLAAGELLEHSLAEWLRANSVAWPF